jgi:hypothetical protein
MFCSAQQEKEDKGWAMSVPSGFSSPPKIPEIHTSAPGNNSQQQWEQLAGGGNGNSAIHQKHKPTVASQGNRCAFQLIFTACIVAC